MAIPFKLPDLSNFAGNLRSGVATVEAEAAALGIKADFSDKEKSKYLPVGLHEVVASQLETLTSEKSGNSYNTITCTDSSGRTAQVFVSTHSKKDNSLLVWDLQALFKAFGYDIPQQALILTDVEFNKKGQGTSVLDYIKIFCWGPVGLKIHYTAPHALYVEKNVYILVDKDDNPEPYFNPGKTSDPFLNREEVEKYAKEVWKVPFFEKNPKNSLVPLPTRQPIPEELEPYYLTLLASIPGSGVKEPEIVEAPSAPRKPMFGMKKA